MLDSTDKSLNVNHPSGTALTLQEPLRHQSLLILELVLIAAVIYLLQIESRRFLFPVFCLIVAGSTINQWLPRRLRRPLFACLSVFCVLFLLGLKGGLCVLGLGGSLIGICYLPFRISVRITLLIVAAVCLTILRIQFPLPFWPILGSMFMFRLSSSLRNAWRRGGSNDFVSVRLFLYAAQCLLSSFSGC